MPRKKKEVEERVVSFLLNPEDKAVIDEMIEYSIDIDILEKKRRNAIEGKPYLVNRDKIINRLKFIYYYICDYICENAHLYEDDVFVNINQERMKKYLKEDISPILKNLMSMNILKCDELMEVGKKSYGYQLTQKEFRAFKINMPAFSEKMATIRQLKAAKITKDGLNDYFQILQKIKIDEDKIKEIKQIVLYNKYQEEVTRKEFDYFMRILNLRFLISHYSIQLHKSSYKFSNLYSSSYTIFLNNTISFYNAETVPENRVATKSRKIIDAETVPVRDFIDAETVPAIVAETVPGKYLPKHIVNIHYNVTRRDMRNETIPWLNEFKIKREQKELESDETTLARIDKAVARVNGNELNISRPKGKSRVYTTITNLNREFRDYLKFDGNSIIGMDLRNSQPLIASIVFKMYWNKKEHALPKDVIEYQSACETGSFYEYFMDKNCIPQELRRQFKIEFFKRVFFSMHTGKPNVLKQQFIDKYPNCWQAVCDIKGGYFCRDYGDFAKLLQEFEADIFYDDINVKLLKMGVSAFNIYDSIYVNNEADYTIAHHVIRDCFKVLGMSPKLQPEYYGTHKTKERKKRKYTVEELLASTMEEDIKPTKQQPSQLQHLKIEGNPSKTAEFERIVQGIREQDEEEEKQLNSIPKNEKELREFVVLHLQSRGEETSKQNIDYLTQVVREELKLKGIVIEKLEQSSYKYVNPYVKKSA